MALSIEELDLQGAEYLPAREVMSSIAGPSESHVGSYDLDYAPSATMVEGNHDNAYGAGSFNGWNVQLGTGPVLSNVVDDINIL